MIAQSSAFCAILKGAPFRHCFLSFPQKWNMKREDSSLSVYRVVVSSREFVLSWAGHTHESEKEGKCVYISSKFLKANEIPDSSSVILNNISCPTPYTDLRFSCLTNEQWDDLNLNTHTVEENLLSQIRLVQKDCIYPIWLDGGAVVFIKLAHSSVSGSFGYIQLNSQVVFLPPQESDAPSLNFKPDCSNQRSATIATSSANKNIDSKFFALLNLMGCSSKEILNFNKEELFLNLRCVPYDCDNFNKETDLFDLLKYHPSLVLISQEFIKDTKYRNSLYFIGNLFKIGDDDFEKLSQNDQSDIDLNSAHAVFVPFEKIASIKNLDNYQDLKLLFRHKNCIISEPLRKRLQFQKESFMFVKTFACDSLNSASNQTFDVSIESSRCEIINNCYRIKSTLTKLSEVYPIIISDWCMISCLESEHFLIKARSQQTLLIDKPNISSVSFVLSDSKFTLEDFFKTRNDSDDVSRDKDIPSINEKTFSKLLEIVKKELNIHKVPKLLNQFVLLQGGSGSGKTTIVKRLIDHISSKPFFVHCQTILSKTLKGKKVESVTKILKTAIKKAMIYQPSLLVIEDLDILIPNLTQYQEKGSLEAYVSSLSNMISVILKDLLRSMRESSMVPRHRDFFTLLVTCNSRSELNPIIGSPVGTNLFPQNLTIDSPTKEEKHSAFKGFLENFSAAVPNIEFGYDIESIISELDGYILSDLKNLALRVHLQASRRYDHEYDSVLNRHIVTEIIDEDIKAALKGFIPLCKKEVSLTVKTESKKVGGLKEVRQALEEMVVWPSKYPGLFAQSRLRPRSGLLLYGPSGCGKTFLAQSLSHEPHLNFISVKGPEILSKYIGQSEKAVRDIFERAERGKPTVVFFDEFESIASRRGHDSTGVTDRVVNQLLTQMDGVEGLSGVYVVAATSRPDLVDPALLRPGRLDKCVYCPLPSSQDRREILWELCKEVSIGDGFDLTELVSRTEGFSGADLRSLVGTAHMIAVKECLPSSPKKSEPDYTPRDDKSFNDHSVDYIGQCGNKMEVLLSFTHFNQALSEVTPSVSQDERRKYEKLHARFTGRNDFNRSEQNKRLTLA